MLGSGTFWIGVAAGAVGYHMYQRFQAKKSQG